MRNRSISFEDACAKYVNRFTMEFVPVWAKWAKIVGNGFKTYHAPQYITDREWYENTCFPGEENWPFQENEYDSYSTNQSWPIGETLNRPYKIRPDVDLRHVELAVAIRDKMKLALTESENLIRAFWEPSNGD